MSQNPTTKQTILEDGTEVDGSIRSNCPITVSGKLKGDVSAPSLTITQSGSVCGQIKVSELKSQGEIAGQIEAESVELSGSVSDQTTIHAASLQVRLNQSGSHGKLQVTFGNCELKVGEPVVNPLKGPAKSASREGNKKELPKFEVISAAQVIGEPELA